MDGDNQYDIKGMNWNPQFKNATTEREFMLEFNSEALKSGRIGVFIILIVWFGFTWFDLRLDDHVRASALFFRLLIIMPLFLLILTALYSKYAISKYQVLTVITLFIIEGGIYYVVKFYDFQAISQSIGCDFPLIEADAKCIFIFVWLLIIFMASVIVRLGVLQSILSCLIYILFSILSIYTYQPSKLITIMVLPFFIATLPIVWIGSLHVQRYARENYRAAKFLAYSMQQSESLLLNILPSQIAKRLKKTPGTIADGFNSVSVLFADIVGFTRLSERYEPEAVVQMLNRIFSEFDNISKQYGVEKIKTIGDAYMLAAGVPETRTNHCDLVADCALDIIAAAEHFSDPGGNPVQIRVGIHTGPAIAGVIGAHKFSYDLWGDTVNTASRMESHGDAGKIQVTREIYEKLKDTFILERRDEIEIKGKGKMQTWWLRGRRTDSMRLDT